MSSKRKDPKRRSLKITAGIVLLAASYVVLAAAGLLPAFWQPERSTQTTTPVMFAEVTRRTVQRSVGVNGNIYPYQNRYLGFPTSGLIDGLYVVEGQSVKKGELLAELDTTTERFNIENKQFELEQERYTGTPRSIALIERQIEVLTEELDRKRIYAPFDGIIAEVTTQEGEIFSVGSSRPYLLHLTDSSKLSATVEISELDIAEVHVEDRVTFEFDALEGEKFTGRVERIARIGRINSRGLTVIDAELLIDQPDPRILTPYSFSAEIITSEPEEVLLLDSGAINWQDDRVLAYPYVQQEEGVTQELSPVELEVAPWSDREVIILSGAQEGDAFIINGPVTADPRRRLRF